VYSFNSVDATTSTPVYKQKNGNKWLWLMIDIDATPYWCLDADKESAECKFFVPAPASSYTTVDLATQPWWINIPSAGVSTYAMLNDPITIKCGSCSCSCDGQSFKFVINIHSEWNFLKLLSL
jgi:hypothetical protein